MDTQQAPEKKKRRFGWKFTRRSASVLVALLMIAAPASASIIVQNYMRADITAAAPCFSKVTGEDPTDSTLATFDSTQTTTVDGVDLIEERISLTGMTGDRVIFTDVVRYQNTCDEAISVQLVSPTVSGTWADVAAEIWLSNVADPADIDPNTEVVGGDDDWNNTKIMVAGDGTISSASAGAVVVPAGSEIQGAFVVSSDVAFTGTTATINWVAEATIVP